MPILWHTVVHVLVSYALPSFFIPSPTMWFWKAVALAGALLTPSLSVAASNDTQWPIHDDGLTTLVEW